MMRNYYDEVLEKISKYIEDTEFEMALKLIDIELSQPYLSISFESELLTLREDIVQELSDEDDYESFESELISDEKELNGMLLESEMSDRLIALNSLALLNARLYMELIQYHLLNNDSPMIRGQLLEVLVAQEVNATVSFTYNGKIIEVNPSTLQLSNELEVIQKVYRQIDDVFAKTPSTIEMVYAVLFEIIYSRYPFDLKLEDKKSIMDEVLKRMESLFGTDFLGNDYTDEDIIN